MRKRKSGLTNTRSTEARTVLVRSWYQTFLGRDASAQEATGWVNTLAAGASQEQVMSLLLGSPEFYARAERLFSTGSSNERFVKALYQVTLNRIPGSAEVLPWLGVVGSRGTTAAAMAIVNSLEYRGLVVKPGRTLTVCEGRAYAMSNGAESLIATMTGTLMAMMPR